MDTGIEYVLMWEEARKVLKHIGMSEHVPRQDQLQEMFDWDYFEVDKVNGKYCCLSGIYLGEHEFTSMEQLWLACLMCMKEKKIWENSEWIDISLCNLAKKGESIERKGRLGGCMVENDSDVLPW